jgi:hypothetical protein
MTNSLRLIHSAAVELRRGMETPITLLRSNTVVPIPPPETIP